MSEPNIPVNLTKAWSFGKDLLTLAVIPLLGWGVKLEVGNAQRDMLIQQQAVEISRLEDRVKEAEQIDRGVHENTLKLVRLEGKLDTANGRLHDIQVLLRR